MESGTSMKKSYLQKVGVEEAKTKNEENRKANNQLEPKNNEPNITAE